MSRLLIVKQTKADPGVAIEVGNHGDEVLAYAVGRAIGDCPISEQDDAWQITRQFLNSVYTNAIGIEPDDLYITSGKTTEWDTSPNVIVVVASDRRVYHGGTRWWFNDFANWANGAGPVGCFGEDINDLWTERDYREWKNLVKAWGK